MYHRLSRTQTDVNTSASQYPLINYFANDTEKESIPFKFDFVNGSLISEKSGIENEGKFMIDAFTVPCETGPIAFEKVEFKGKLEELKTDEVQNQYVLVTYDLNDKKKGILNYGNFNGPLAKSSNGMPDIK